MSVSIIDGTLEAANVKWRGGDSLYDSIVIRRADGGEARLRKIMVADTVADAMQPGIRGRFYLYSVIDHNGLHGLRTTDGVAIHEFPGSHEELMRILLIFNLVLLIGRFALEGKVWHLPLAVVGLVAIVYPFYRKTRMESRRQFDADGDYSAARLGA